jgi:ABC-type phosphate transport system auxiliary subunit
VKLTLISRKTRNQVTLQDVNPTRMEQLADELRGLVGSAETVALFLRESNGELVPINVATVNNLDAG